MNDQLDPEDRRTIVLAWAIIELDSIIQGLQEYLTPEDASGVEVVVGQCKVQRVLLSDQWAERVRENFRDEDEALDAIRTWYVRVCEDERVMSLIQSLAFAGWE